MGNIEIVGGKKYAASVDGMNLVYQIPWPLREGREFYKEGKLTIYFASPDGAISHGMPEPKNIESILPEGCEKVLFSAVNHHELKRIIESMTNS